MRVDVAGRLHRRGGRRSGTRSRRRRRTAACVAHRRQRQPRLTEARGGFERRGIRRHEIGGAVVTGRHTFDWAGGWEAITTTAYRSSCSPTAHQTLRHRAPPATSQIPDWPVAQTKSAAGCRDVMVHGASAARSLLQIGLIHELPIHLVSLLRAVVDGSSITCWPRSASCDWLDRMRATVYCTCATKSQPSTNRLPPHRHSEHKPRFAASDPGYRPDWEEPLSFCAQI